LSDAKKAEAAAIAILIFRLYENRKGSFSLIHVAIADNIIKGNRNLHS
jgi:hypothetical protein